MTDMRRTEILMLGNGQNNCAKKTPNYKKLGTHLQKYSLISLYLYSISTNSKFFNITENLPSLILLS